MNNDDIITLYFGMKNYILKDLNERNVISDLIRIQKEFGNYLSAKLNIDYELCVMKYFREEILLNNI